MIHIKKSVASSFVTTIIGNYGSHNIGDETLLKQIIENEMGNDYDSNAEGKKFYIPTRNPEFVDLYHKEYAGLICAVPTANILSCTRALLESKRVIIGGGGIWSGFTGPFAHMIPIIAILSKMLGKRVEFISVGLYDTSSPVDRSLVNLAFLLADSVSVRDQESYANVWKTSKKKTNLVDDLSVPYLKRHKGLNDRKVYTESLSEYRVLSENKRAGRLIVGVSVKPLKEDIHTIRLIDEISEAINNLNERYGSYLFFAFFPFAKTRSDFEDDTMIFDRIYQKLRIKDSIIQINHGHPLAWYYAIEEFVDVFICMRYHSLIFALEAGKPVFCIPYERKIFQYLSSRRLNQDGSSTISVFDPKEMSKLDVITFLERYCSRFS